MKYDPKAILHDMERFRQTGSVLYIAAHPDDENTELLTYLSRGRSYRAAYLSITRGDGGQNLLGSDLGEKLGVARTQELLAARRIDGAQQFFTRAIDFGYSKDYKETLTIWDKRELLYDIVLVIRKFRPDVFVARFSPSPGGTHGHHTTSTILAQEAFKLAGDPSAYPEMKLEAWQPKRLLWNLGRWQKDKVTTEHIVKVDITGKDPVTGDTFFDVANASRAMHKTQGFDLYKLSGNSNDQRTESFQLLDGAPFNSDIMDGIDTTWHRFKNGDQIGKSISEIIDKFDPKNPSASVPALLKLRSDLKALPVHNQIIVEKQALLDRILQECLGLNVETTIVNSDVVPGEKMKLQASAKLNAINVPVTWIAVRFPKLKKSIERGVKLKAGENSQLEIVETLPAETPLSQPYWLRTEGTPGLFHVDDPALIGTADNAPVFPVENVFKVDGQELIVYGEPVQKLADATGYHANRRMDIIPPVSLRFVSEVAIMTPGSSKSLDIEVKAARAGCHGTLQLDAKDGWLVKPAKEPFEIKSTGEVKKFTFTITAPKQSKSTVIRASAYVNNKRYQNQHVEISYKHLPRQILQPPAVVKAVSLDLKKLGTTIGYIPGAGDTLAENMEQMGYTVRILDDAKLTSADLKGLDAVVLGVRAFNVRPDIGKSMPALLSYVEEGGTMIVQYCTDQLKTDKIAPYPITISRDRVTNEKAEITFLAPDHRVLNVPNKISHADFDGWVQERGLYFPNKWDEHFTPILACNDVGEPPTKGSLLIARYGKGNYVYTGISFFRQLPSGNPGAYRLFANLTSLSH